MDRFGALVKGPSDVMSELAATINEDLEILKDALRKGGFGLNESKEETVHFIPSKIGHRVFLTAEVWIVES
jgi:hypothetical protein